MKFKLFGQVYSFGEPEDNDPYLKTLTARQRNFILESVSRPPKKEDRYITYLQTLPQKCSGCNKMMGDKDARFYYMVSCVKNVGPHDFYDNICCSSTADTTRVLSSVRYCPDCVAVPPDKTHETYSGRPIAAGSLYEPYDTHR